MECTDHETIAPGRRVDRYVLGERIGSGATSWVFEAIHEKVGNAVAIKVLRPDVRDDESLRTRFERELHALAEIRSRHVPQVHDMGELDGEGLPFVVMERLRGVTLRERIKEQERLSIDEAVELGIQLAAALAAAHAAGVVHRDVKPSNLVLHEESDGRRVLKLLDFGICVPADEDEPKLTLPGKTVGTPDYMSPEQARGMPLDARSDVFSAGSVLYEMLAGRSPFGGRSPQAIARAVTRKEARPLRELREDCPAALAEVVHRALEKELDARIPSASALRDALRDLREQRGEGDHAGSRGATVTMGAHDPSAGRRPHLELVPELDDDPSQETDAIELPLRPLWQRAAMAAIVLLGIGWGVLHVTGRTEEAWVLLGGDAGPRASAVAHADVVEGEDGDRGETGRAGSSLDRLDVLARAAQRPLRMPEGLSVEDALRRQGEPVEASGRTHPVGRAPVAADARAGDRAAAAAERERNEARRTRAREAASRARRERRDPPQTTVLVNPPPLAPAAVRWDDVASRIRVPMPEAPSRQALPPAEPEPEVRARYVTMPGNPY